MSRCPSSSASCPTSPCCSVAPVLTSLFVMLLFALPADGLTIRVTNTQDSIEPDALRGAIIEANRLGGDNTIILQPGTYQLSIPGAHEDACYMGDLDVTAGHLTIIGLSSNVVINATGLAPVYELFEGCLKVCC